MPWLAGTRRAGMDAGVRERAFSLLKVLVTGTLVPQCQWARVPAGG